MPPAGLRPLVLVAGSITPGLNGIYRRGLRAGPADRLAGWPCIQIVPVSDAHVALCCVAHWQTKGNQPVAQPDYRELAAVFAGGALGTLARAALSTLVVPD